MLSNYKMFYRSLDSYLATPQPRIENDLQRRQTATINERENELKQQIETKNIFYGGLLEDRFEKLENNIMNLLDKKLKILETKIKLDDLKQDEVVSEDEDDTDEESEDDDTDEESEDEDDTDEESEDDDTDEESEDKKHLKAKQEKRRQYLKAYHQNYYLKNKQKKLKNEL